MRKHEFALNFPPLRLIVADDSAGFTAFTHTSRLRAESLNVCLANLASISGANLLKSALRQVFREVLGGGSCLGSCARK